MDKDLYVVNIWYSNQGILLDIPQETTDRCSGSGNDIDCGKGRLRVRDAVGSHFASRESVTKAEQEEEEALEYLWLRNIC